MLKLKSGIIKNLLVLVFLSLITVGCNVNPNKEARIQKLESEMTQTMERIDNLERKVETLEGINKQQKARILELEN